MGGNNMGGGMAHGNTGRGYSMDIGDSGMSDNDMTGMMGSHKTYFHSEPKLTVLLEALSVDSPLGIFIVGVIFVIISMCYEGIRCLRLHLAEKHQYGKKQIFMTSIPHLIQTGLFFGEIIFTYTLMLMVMTFNVWMLVAVVTGSAIGFQLCRLLSDPHKNLLAEKVKSCKPVEKYGSTENNAATENSHLKSGTESTFPDKEKENEEKNVAAEESEALVSSL